MILQLILVVVFVLLVLYIVKMDLGVFQTPILSIQIYVTINIPHTVKLYILLLKIQ